MTLPSFNDMIGLDYAWKAQPWCVVAAKSTIDTGSLDYAWKAQPVCYAPAAPLTSIAGHMLLLF